MIKNNTTYKNTAIGLIPSDWEVKTLGEVSDYLKGFAFNSNDYSTNGIRIIRISDTTTNSIKDDGAIYLDILKAPNYKKWELKVNDLVFTTVGSKPPMYDSMVGKVIKIEKRHEGSLLNQNAVIIRSKDIVNQDFIFNQFKLKRYLNFIETIVRGNANQVSITLDNLFQYQLIIPPLPEQQKIASILSTWDKAIDNCKSIIEELKIRNKGLVNKLILDNGELKVKLGNVFVESKIPTTNADVNKRITVRLTLKGIEKRGVRGSELEEATTYYLRKSGQFIYGKQNLHKGAFGIIPDELDGFESSSDIPAFDINKEYNSKYIFYYFTRRHFYEKLEDISTGTGSKRIQPRELYKVEIKVPSTLEKQNAIVKIIDTATEELKQYEQKLETLQLQKKGLMQQLLTGKTRVKI